jgi:hypothetical protein
LLPSRIGSIRLGSIRLGSIRLGSIRLGSIRLGSIRRSQPGTKQRKQGRTGKKGVASRVEQQANLAATQSRGNGIFSRQPEIAAATTYECSID